MKEKPGFPWRSKDRDARAIEYLSRREDNKVWKQTETMNCIAVNKAKRSGDLKISLSFDMEVQSLEYAFLIFCFAAVCISLLFSLSSCL